MVDFNPDYVPTGPNNRANEYYKKINHVKLAKVDSNRKEFFGTVGGVPGDGPEEFQWGIGSSGGFIYGYDTGQFFGIFGTLTPDEVTIKDGTKRTILAIIVGNAFGLGADEVNLKIDDTGGGFAIVNLPGFGEFTLGPNSLGADDVFSAVVPGLGAYIAPLDGQTIPVTIDATNVLASVPSFGGALLFWMDPAIGVTFPEAGRLRWDPAFSQDARHYLANNLNAPGVYDAFTLVENDPVANNLPTIRGTTKTTETSGRPFMELQGVTAINDAQHVLQLVIMEEYNPTEGRTLSMGNNTEIMGSAYGPAFSDPVIPKSIGSGSTIPSLYIDGVKTQCPAYAPVPEETLHVVNMVSTRTRPVDSIIGRDANERNYVARKGDVLVYNRALTDQEAIVAENWIRTKYNMPLLAVPAAPPNGVISTRRPSQAGNVRVFRMAVLDDAIKDPEVLLGVSPTDITIFSDVGFGTKPEPQFDMTWDGDTAPAKPLRFTYDDTQDRYIYPSGSPELSDYINQSGDFAPVFLLPVEEKGPV